MMKRANSRRLRISMRLKLFKNGEVIYRTAKLIKSHITSETEAMIGKFDTGNIKVIYKPGVFNDGDFTTLKDLKEYLAIFTEKPLVDYIEKATYST